jgi:hypothetical protein
MEGFGELRPFSLFLVSPSYLSYPSTLLHRDDWDPLSRSLGLGLRIRWKRTPRQTKAGEARQGIFQSINRT